MSAVKTGSKRIKIDIPAAVAEQRFGTSVAAIMDQLATSVASSAKGRPPREFNWSIQYVRADDPDTDDYSEFVKHLRDHSQVWLVANGYHWRGEQKLGVPPSQVMANFETHAKMICGSRQRLPQPDDSTDLASPTRPSVAIADVRELFADWCLLNPRANKSLIEIVRLALGELE